jgi:hypothetical protein
MGITSCISLPITMQYTLINPSQEFVKATMDPSIIAETYGDFDVLIEDDVELGQRDLFLSKISGANPAAFFYELFMKDQDIRIVMVKNTCPHDGLNRLLFIEGSLFQHYISDNIPFLHVQDQGSILLATPITENMLWELSSEISFRSAWVLTYFLSNAKLY